MTLYTFNHSSRMIVTSWRHYTIYIQPFIMNEANIFKVCNIYIKPFNKNDSNIFTIFSRSLLTTGRWLYCPHNNISIVKFIKLRHSVPQNVNGVHTCMSRDLEGMDTNMVNNCWYYNTRPGMYRWYYTWPGVYRYGTWPGMYRWYYTWPGVYGYWQGK